MATLPASPLEPEIVQALDRLSADDAAAALPFLEAGAAFLVEELMERRLFRLDRLRDGPLRDDVDEYLARANQLQVLRSGLLQSDPSDEVGSTTARLGELTQHIRTVDGYGGFLRFPGQEFLASLNYAELVLYLVAGPDLGWAVLQAPGSAPLVTALPLPEFRDEVVRDQALRSWFTFASQPDFSAVTDGLDKVAAWCWDACMGVVCANLPAGQRLTIIPLGWAAMLPLQVAYVDDPGAACGRRYALDHLTISYAPNLRVAAVARQPSPAGVDGVAAFAPNAADGPGALPFSGPEANRVIAIWGGDPALLDGEATPERFVASLKAVSVVHFAGHARSSPSVPWASALRFGDEWLTLSDLAGGLGAAGADLVVLSACTSTLASAGVNAPRGITIANVLLALGVHGAVATQWRVIDDASALVASRFQELLHPSGGAVAGALQSAQQWLRDAPTDSIHATAAGIGMELESEIDVLRSPVAWGSFVHTGR
jgi:hypothetical protein